MLRSGGLCALALSCLCAGPARAADYAIGADLSFLNQAEVAYCWRPTEYRKRSGPFPETPEGQREFLDAVNRIVLGAPHHRGMGVF